MTRRLRLEGEVAEYVLGLDALGLGGKAAGIWWRSQLRDVRPLLNQQRALLDRAIRSGDPTKEPEAAVLALDEEIGNALERCLEQLRILWLTEQPHPEGEDAA